MMNVEIKPELEQRLLAIAEERSQSVSELIERAMTAYVEAVEGEASIWVQATQRGISKVWPAEDFYRMGASGWHLRLRVKSGGPTCPAHSAGGRY
jgi:predicted DNA-binding protein